MLNVRKSIMHGVITQKNWYPNYRNSISDFELDGRAKNGRHQESIASEPYENRPDGLGDVIRDHGTWTLDNIRMSVE